MHVAAAGTDAPESDVRGTADVVDAAPLRHIGVQGQNDTSLQLGSYVSLWSPKREVLAPPACTLKVTEYVWDSKLGLERSQNFHYQGRQASRMNSEALRA